MMPGPDQIVACPHCKGLAKHFTLASGNTFGARSWTDGKRIAPMLPQPPAVVKCRHCGECYWLADAERIGRVPAWGRRSEGVDPAWAAAQSVEEPTEEGYYAALKKGLAKTEQQERNLRVLAWWRRNDAHRHAAEGSAQAAPSSACRANLEALAGLLEGGESDRLMRAEVLRELGEFERALRALDGVASKEALDGGDGGPYGAAVRQMRALCEARDASVRVLRFD
jgi:hypothetical protein